VDKVRPVAGRLDRTDHARRAKQVGLGGEVGRVVELDGRSRVDHDRALAKLLSTCIREAEAIRAKVDLQHLELFFDALRESFVAQLLLEPFEGRARQHLALQPFRGWPAPPRG
jgi:hypothetical protein